MARFSSYWINIEPNNRMHTDSKKRRSFVAMLFAAVMRSVMFLRRLLMRSAVIALLFAFLSGCASFVETRVSVFHELEQPCPG